jgi:hypothetical protein
VDLLYSKDGGAFTGLTSINPIELVGTNFNDLVASLSQIGVVKSSLIFRIIVDPAHPTSAQFNADPTTSPTIGAAGTFRFASYSPPSGVFLNPEITGQAVPEPSTVILSGLAIGLLGIASRRRARGSAA